VTFLMSCILGILLTQMSCKQSPTVYEATKN